MADVVRQIRHDIEQLEKAVAALGEEFNQGYDNYLVALRTSVQKQVVLACYHLCTQSYPERFLELSFRQRETLQQAIQRCIQELQQKLEHAYVLAIASLVEEEEELIPRPKRRRSLPASERSSKRRGRGDSRNRRAFDDESPDQDGPSIELIAITNMDGDDALDAAQDPFLAAALSEFADSLALDEEAILKRVKQELLRKANRSSSKALEGSTDGATDGAIDESIEEEKSEEDKDPNAADGPEESLEHSSVKDENSTDATLDDAIASAKDHGPGGTDAEANSDDRERLRSEVSAIALSHHVSSASSSKASGHSPSHSSNIGTKAPTSEKTPFPQNPDGKRFSDCDETLTPDILATRQEQLEENLKGFLRDLSKQINDELHSVGMIPKKIPTAVLRAALQTDMSSEFNGAPNVLNLLVEAEGKAKDSKVMRVTALRLRPPELEFSDPQLSACRSRIRELTGKLQTLGKKYHKKQREKAIAEAESAWRSSWYERKD